LTSRNAGPRKKTVSHRVEFGRYALDVETLGTHGSPVVLVHSTGMTSRQWKRLAERLAPMHRVYLPDLIGYGASSKFPTSEPFDWTLDVVGIESLLDAIVEPVHLVGHSYGGLLALAAALHRRGRIRSLACVEPVAWGVLRAKGDVSFAFESMPYYDRLVLPDEADAAEKWLTWFVDYWNGEGAFAALPERMRASFFATIGVCFGEVRSLLEDRTTASTWATIDAPSLFIRGERSPREARRVAEVLAQSLPHAALYEVRGAGHMSPLTHADEVAARIAEHIESA
jgi:pimeloyl-ACP methyl ester carboxylesterase